jgi:uncharacterized delta-60 repeat protein
MVSTRIGIGAVVSIALSSLAFADGSVTLDFGASGEDKILSLKLGQDGRIYALVDTEVDSRECGLYALDEAGTLIPDFAQGGRLRPRLSCAADFAVRADNSIVTAIDRFGSSGVNLVFYDASGKELSVSATNIPLLSDNRVEGFALAVQPDNKMVVAGRTRFGNAGPPRWELFRWNVDGSVDEDFFSRDLPGTGGDPTAADGLVALPDGKLLVSGLAGRDSYQTNLFRLLADGDQDATFATEGLYAVPGNVTPEQHVRGGLAADANGRIYLLAGNGVDLIRLTPNGARDTGFATVTTPAGRLSRSIVLDSSGRPIVAGVTSELTGTPQAYLARYTLSGSLDPTFGETGTGIAIAPLPRAIFGDMPNCKVAIQGSAGKLILACTVSNIADAQAYQGSDITFARFNTDGTLDVRFGAAQGDTDRYPDAFAFNIPSVPANTKAVQSAPVTITGFEGPAGVRLQGPKASGAGFSVGCNNFYSDQPTSIRPGQTLCVRHDASATLLGTADTGIDVGGRYVVYTTRSTSETAAPAPNPGSSIPGFGISLPNSFAFPSVNGVPVATLITSNTVTVTGLMGASTVSIENGEFSIGCTQSFTSAPTSIGEGSQLCVRHLSAATGALSMTTQVTVTNKIGDATATFSTSFTSTTQGTSTQTSSRSGGGGALDYMFLLVLASLGVLGKTLTRERPSYSHTAVTG